MTFIVIHNYYFKNNLWHKYEQIIREKKNGVLLICYNGHATSTTTETAGEEKIQNPAHQIDKGLSRSPSCKVPSCSEALR